ncbi:probable LRR receptor-like serine/threonine-protein kinase At1g53440 isoform X1 [Ricinus communis]|uniref:probable LRR receptor-like serine/threonine-protein kinase At1g53440 isoform X1 n=1 Tax=Ricinus communis TaxID=3988 RepID=UPI00077270C5|nr:probable LRR receptor-like serine/threonine-protein kinase At1g53440 isoform X1 [Ricinus communis]XP_025012731.1 probable LRR receptor-like serine/threonine-protein kinase At1g53440 isoform X1 [Ricinus communis]XP_048235534.1 probable LRR receptor-like serine/threonine-protein kinase At1g53440 isoform X1 [Ricinus communis]XP_048235535.1 probable LRR receptor-like serine/threonine-protein kinase At1g53440 isoform X1 [Ricinus communis]XP_048235536.1 probable LRR receptor-like serine/threonine-|eukprot:XP_015573292.1 probable LRR receptor-like serine/threonine-protein kinase At1g53440 isoform X1 [Ricinus communis]
MNLLQRSIEINLEDLQSANLHEETYVEVQDGWITLTELINATRNFSPEMEIGRGCFGIIYKAELQNYQAVAVKKLSPQSEKIINLTINEIETLKLLNHENVLPLLDFYSSEILNFLVYEYMANGSLHRVLHDVSTPVILNWEARFNICLGIAKGLMYLHSKSVVHRNIKSSNILLNETLTPKISNTGLVKDIEEENQNMFTQASVLTQSYMAPENAQQSDITEKVDVYSYGILLLEIVSGEECIDHKKNDNHVSLLDKALDLHGKGRLVDLVDGRLSNFNTQQAIYVLKLAIMCTNMSPSLRPAMSDIVVVLEGDKTIEQISEVHSISS